MSKIILVNSMPYPYYPAIGIGYIAAYVNEQGHEAIIFDAAHGIEAFKAILKKHDPQFVGFNSFTGGLLLLEELINITRDWCGVRAKILIGGHHVTAAPRESWEQFDCDYLVLGEAEHKVLDIMNRIPITKMKGIIGWDGIHVYENFTLEYIEDLDRLPFPDRDAMNSKNYQQEFRKKKRMYTQIAAGRGCPRNCAFCTNNKLWGTSYRQRSVGNVLDEIEWLLPQGYEEFDILDDTFTGNKDYVLAFCQGIKDRGLDISYQIQGRVDMFDKEMADALVETGCHNILLGVESCNQQTLKFLRKGTNVEQIKKAIRAGEDAGLNVSACLMYNIPNESAGDLLHTFKVITELNPYWIFLTPLTIFPGSGLESYFEKHHIPLGPTDYKLDGTQIIHSYMKGFTAESINWLVQRFRYRYLTRRAYIKHIFKYGWMGFATWSWAVYKYSKMAHINTLQAKILRLINILIRPIHRIYKTFIRREYKKWQVEAKA